MSETLSYEEYLDRFGTLTYRNVGTSMLPLLREGRDLFTVRRKGVDRCRVGDVVLYRRPPSHYVLHRVVQVLPDSYVLLGDNCLRREMGVTDADIVGVMVSFERDGHGHLVDEAAYRAYVRLWLFSEPVRTFAKGMWQAMRRHVARWR